MKKHWPWTVLVANACLVLGCGSQSQPLNPSSFLRPERVAFVCVRLDKAGERVPVPLEQCSPCTGHTGEHSMYALVTQTARGELAAADLSSGRVIDTQSTIPGATFVAVGDAPSAVVVPPLDGRRTYVASFGSSDLRVLDTRGLIDREFSGAATLATIPLGFLMDGRWTEAEPVDMVLSPDETRLLIAAPRMHGLIAVETADLERVIRGELNAVDVPLALIALSGLTSDATLVTSTGSDRYQVSCGLSAPPQPSQVVASRVIAATADPASPVRIAVDAINNRVLVADAALPVIHVVDLVTLTETLQAGRPYFVTGTPTLDVVMSPPVPASPDDAAFERYVYAIDAERRDVLVLNDRGVMQSVNAAGSGRPDRIDFAGASIMSLEVIEPGFRGCSPNVSLAGPRYLHGVFLAAAGLDGRIRIADVYDLDAAKRCQPTTTDPPSTPCSVEAPCAVFQRHRPRIASTFTSPLPCATPSLFGQDGEPIVLPRTATAGATTPTLSAVVCAPGKSPAHSRVTVPAVTGEPAVTFACPATPLPSEQATAETVACVNADPWTMGTESNWAAVWEGDVPGSLGSGALTELDEGWQLTDNAFDFCAVGVEGGARYVLELLVVPAAQGLIDLYDAQSGFTGDVECADFVEPESNGTRPRLTFEITDARSDTLTLAKMPVDVPPAFVGDKNNPEVLVAKAKHCVAGQRFDFVVRSNGRYTVRGSRTDFSHRVARRSDGACEAPPEADDGALRDGQAVPGRLYENGSIAFQISALEGGVKPVRDLTFGFSISTAPAFLNLNAGITASTAVATVLPELRYNPIDGRLYAVDSASRGLMPISLRPFPSDLPNRFTFQ